MQSTIHCARCEYDLRMLDPAGLCPECALPIADSIAAAADGGASARRNVRRGAGICCIAVALRVAVLPFSPGLFELRLVIQVLDPWPAQLAAMVVLVLLRDTASEWFWGRAVFVLSFVLEVAGVLYLTHGGHEGRTVQRLITRWAVLGSVIYFSFAAIMPAIDASLGPLRKPVLIVITMLPPIAIVLWTAHLVVRDNRRVRGRNIIGWIAVIAVSFDALARSVALYGGRRIIDQVGEVLITLTAVAALSVMWFKLWRMSRPAPAR